LTQRLELVFPSGQQFMGICLMADIPDYLIIGTVENPVQGNRQLDNSQAGGQMPTVNSHDSHKFLPDFISQLLELLDCKFFQIRGAIYVI
jgi:hypothetical protein